MGWGDFGSNGSVHWRVGYTDNQTPDHVDYDTKPHKDIGNGKSPKPNHPQNFRVTARYRNAAQAYAGALDALIGLFADQSQARRAVTDALAGQKAANKDLVLDVKVRPASQDPGDPDDWEVRVDW